MREKIGKITIEHRDTIQEDKNGADKLRKIVEWMNKRPEHLNQNKSHLDLIVEYNTAH